ncbi:MAG TPA: DUF5715 family protein [Thermoanaerobaculia bacterium]|jgi:hypothetical protein
MKTKLVAAGFIVTAALLGCRGEGGGGTETSATGGVAPAPQAAAPADRSDGVATAPRAAAPADRSDAEAEARSRAALEQRLAEIERVIQRLPGLIRSIRKDMRRHLNATHVAAARSNGVGPVRDDAHLATLVDRGALVQLPASTHWWVLRDLNDSLPYVTPHTRAALEEVGRRFHARLDEHGLPPFRLDITSVLRTSQQQAALQRRNPNAADTTSSHEFGTTVDIAYLSFAAPQSLDHRSLTAEIDDQVSPALRAEMTARLESFGKLHAPHLEGELGAVLQQLERDGLLLPLRERSQPVYHITLARDR